MMIQSLLRLRPLLLSPGLAHPVSGRSSGIEGALGGRRGLLRLLAASFLSRFVEELLNGA